MQDRLEKNVPQVFWFTVEMPHWFSCKSVGKSTYIERVETKLINHSSPQNNATILTVLCCPEKGLELDGRGAILSQG